MTRLAAVLAIIAAGLVAAPAAGSATVDEIAAGLRSDPVYVEPSAEPTLTTAEADRLRGAISASAARPVFVAVVGSDAVDEAGGDAEALLDRIADAVGIAGTYAVVADGSFRATGRGAYAADAVAGAADAAFAEGRADGVAAVLESFVRRLGTAERGEGGFPPGPGGGETAPRAPAAGDESADEGASGFAVFGLGGLLLPLLLFGGGFLFLRRLVRGRALGPGDEEPPYGLPPTADRRSFADVRAVAEQDVLDLGSDIYELDPQVHAREAPREAVDDYRRAVGHYDRAQELLGEVSSADELETVTAAIEEGRYALAAVRARLSGDELPERRPPCFFDPRHGPSTTDVEWAPPGGVPRLVPACAMDADRIRHGQDPQARELLVDGERMPYWDAPERYRGWAGGWFGGFGGPALLGGLLLGGLGGMYAGGVFAPDEAGSAEDGWDAGGGDFGADVGGGDFGGGDVGGGDL